MRPSLTRTVKIIAVALTAIVGLGIAAAPAEAAGSCPADTLCVWSSPNYTGTRLTYTFVRGSQVVYPPMDNNISSYKNTSDWPYTGHYSYDCSSMYIDMPAHYNNPSIVGSANNEISRICQP